MFKVLLCMLLFTTPLLAQDWLIIANGLPRDIESLKKLADGRKTIALDGAINRFKTGDFHPDILMGDFDSVDDPGYWGIQNDQSPHLGRNGLYIIPAYDQSYTDLEKALIYCTLNSSLSEKNSIIIAQGTGLGRLDHNLGNLGLLRKYHSPYWRITLLTTAQQVEFVKNGTTTIEGEVGDYCAIMGYPEATMTTTGLTYNGNNYPLILGISESVCNTLAEPTATVKIEGEALVIKPFIQ